MNLGWWSNSLGFSVSLKEEGGEDPEDALLSLCGQEGALLPVPAGYGVLQLGTGTEMGVVQPFRNTIS